MENPCASSKLQAPSPDAAVGIPTRSRRDSKQSDRLLTAYGLRLTAAAAGFLLTLQTIWILRPGTLGGVPWPLATIGIYASDVVLFVAAVVGAICLWRGGDLPPAPPVREFEISNLKSVVRGRGTHRNVLTALVLFVVVAGANTWMSVDPWLSAVGWLRIIAFLLAFAGIPSWSASALRAFLGGFLLAILGHIVLGFIQFATGHGFASTLLGMAAHDAFVRGDAVVEAAGGRWLRAYGGLPHPNVFGTALLVAMVVLARRPVRSFIIHHSLFIILTFTLVLTFSRAALLGLVILLIVWVVRNETRRLAITGTLAMVAAFVVTAPLWAPRITGSTPNEQRSLSERRNGFEAAIAFGSAPPYLGVGGLHAMPQVLWDFRPYLREHTVTPWTWAQPAHSAPLLALAEIGPIGIFVLALVLFLLFRNSLFIGHYSLFSLALVPALLFDHHLWSLPVGIALVFALMVSISPYQATKTCC